MVAMVAVLVYAAVVSSDREAAIDNQKRIEHQMLLTGQF